MIQNASAVIDRRRAFWFHTPNFRQNGRGINRRTVLKIGASLSVLGRANWSFKVSPLDDVAYIKENRTASVGSSMRDFANPHIV